MKKIVASVVLMIFVASLSRANPGDSTAGFLRIGPGAKSAAMGEAYAGMTGDLLSLYHNPAGMANIKSHRYSFSHALWFEDINYSNFTFGIPLGGGYAAVGLSGLFVGPIDKYDFRGDAVGDSFSPSDIAAVVSFARKEEGSSDGVALKYITSEIDGHRADAFAIDLGAVRHYGKFDVGVSVQNIGPKMKFRKKSEKLPFKVRLGASYPLYRAGYRVQAAAEALYSVGIPLRGNAGLNFEFPIDKLLLSMRLGMKSYAEGLDFLSHFTGGFGLEYEGFGFDYAVASFEDLGLTHRVSLSYMLRSYEKAEEEEGEETLFDNEGKDKTEYSDDDNSANEMFMEAHDLFAEGHYEESLSAFKEFLETWPGHENAESYVNRIKIKLEE